MRAAVFIGLHKGNSGWQIAARVDLAKWSFVEVGVLERELDMH